jgi:hypothetical protein
VPQERTQREASSSVNAFNTHITVSALAFDVRARALACACSRARMHTRGHVRARAAFPVHQPARDVSPPTPDEAVALETGNVSRARWDHNA